MKILNKLKGNDATGGEQRNHLGDRVFKREKGKKRRRFGKSNIDYTKVLSRDWGGEKIHSLREMKIMIPEIIDEKTKIAVFNGYQNQIVHYNK